MTCWACGKDGHVAQECEAISEITPSLYLSGYNALIPSNLATLGITYLIKAAPETLSLPPGIAFDHHVHIAPRNYRHGGPQDKVIPQAEISLHFDDIGDKIKEIEEAGEKTLITCNRGVSRSPTFALAYLIKYKGLSLEKALKKVQDVRLNINPNEGFRAQLAAYEKECRSLERREALGVVSAFADTGTETKENTAHHGNKTHQPPTYPPFNRRLNSGLNNPPPPSNHPHGHLNNLQNITNPSNPSSDSNYGIRSRKKSRHRPYNYYRKSKSNSKNPPRYYPS